MRRRGVLVLMAMGLAAVALMAPAAASADVLASPPANHYYYPGQKMKWGIWYQSYSGGSRRVTMTVRHRGQLVARKVTNATTTWRYFFYKPTDEGLYTITVKTANGTFRWVRRAAA
jgi:hypothetical protein